MRGQCLERLLHAESIAFVECAMPLQLMAHLLQLGSSALLVHVVQPALQESAKHLVRVESLGA